MPGELKDRYYLESYQLLLDLIGDDPQSKFSEYLYKIKNVPSSDNGFVLHFKHRRGSNLLFFERHLSGNTYVYGGFFGRLQYKNTVESITEMLALVEKLIIEYFRRRFVKRSACTNWGLSKDGFKPVGFNQGRTGFYVAEVCKYYQKHNLEEEIK